MRAIISPHYTIGTNRYKMTKSLTSFVALRHEENIFNAYLQKHKIMFYETFEHFLFAFSIWLKMTGFLTFEKFFEQLFATYFLVNRKCWTLSLKLAVKAN